MHLPKPHAGIFIVRYYFSHYFFASLKSGAQGPWGLHASGARMDGYRISVDNGTAGGDPDDVFLKKDSGSFDPAAVDV